MGYGVRHDILGGWSWVQYGWRILPGLAAWATLTLPVPTCLRVHAFALVACFVFDRVLSNSQALMAPGKAIVEQISGRKCVSPILLAGKYTVTGFALDSQVANKILSGMIKHPPQRVNYAMSHSVNVTPEKTGTVLHVEFTPPYGRSVGT